MLNRKDSLDESTRQVKTLCFFNSLCEIASGICAGTPDFGFPPPSENVMANRIANMAVCIAEELWLRAESKMREIYAESTDDA